MATILNNIGGSVSINGRSYEGVQKMVIEEDGTIIVNGKPISEYTEDKCSSGTHIEIVGDVDSLSVDRAVVEVKGKVGAITSHNGNITCGNVEGNVESNNGNITCGQVQGDVFTKNGNIIRNK